MFETIFKFPSTPHLVWLGQGSVRDDKILTPQEANEFMSGNVILEEKVDGANLGISFDAASRMRFQNRGNWIEGKLTGQWQRLRVWAAEHETALREVLPQDHILFGEWCYTMHSIHYDSLPDWFLAFDVYDARARKFWSVARRNALASAAHVATIPEVSSGIFTKAAIIGMLDGPSSYARKSREGLYLRREEGDWLLNRAKVVRSEFTQSIEEHWSNKQLIPNRIQNISPAQWSVKSSAMSISPNATVKPTTPPCGGN